MANGMPGVRWAQWATSIFWAAALGGIVLLVSLHMRAPFAAFMVSGNSMEPGIHAGDLVIVRGKPDGYAVGDSVAYRHRDLGPVLHRIVGDSAAGFILQGDNREGPDAYPVAPGEVFGVLVVRVPSAGRILRGSGSTEARIGLASIAAVALLAGGFASWRHHRGPAARDGAHAHGGTHEAGPLRRGEYFAVTPSGVHVAAGMAAGALVALGALGVVTMLGASGPTTASEPYEQRGVFAYTAAGAPGVYDEPSANTGDPVFRRLAQQLEVRFRYSFRSSAVGELTGVYRMNLRLTQANGWNRTLELVPPTAFVGRTVEVTGIIDLQTVQGVIDAMEAQTGVGGRSYLMTLLPVVTVEGVVAGHDLKERFAPEQRFLIDPQVVQPQPPIGSNELSFERSQNGSISVTEMGERTLNVVGISIVFATLRSAALLTLGVTVPGLLGWSVATFVARRGDEAAVIEAQYGALLVRGRLDQLPVTPTLISVESMDDLVRIAEQQGVPVIAEHADGGNASQEFVVITPDGVAYHYNPHSRALGHGRQEP